MMSRIIIMVPFPARSWADARLGLGATPVAMAVLVLRERCYTTQSG